MRLRVSINIAVFWGVLLCLLLGCAVANAASRSTRLYLDTDSLVSAQRANIKQSGTMQSIRAVRISGYLRGFGPLRGTLNKGRNKNWNSYFTGVNGKVLDSSAITLMRGSFQLSDGRAAPIAGAVYEIKKMPTLVLNFQGKRKNGRSPLKYYEIRVPLSGGTRFHYIASIRKIPASILKKLKCGVLPPVKGNSTATFESPFGTEPSTTYVPSTLPSTLRVIEVATESDYDLYQIYGSSTNSHVAALINAAEIIYERDLSMTFTIKTQNTITSSGTNYPYTDATLLLPAFQDRNNDTSHLGSADAYHLFTGKDLDSGVIGLAYVGALCVAADYSYGLSQRYDDAIDYITFAHEMGHNVNATHDSSTVPHTIMYPSADATQTSFSAFSSGEISSFVSTYGSCFSSVSSGTPTPTPAPGDPTPVPTATPSGGGGGGGGADPGENPNLPSISFQSSYSKSGTLVALLTTSGGVSRSTCEISLLVSLKSNLEKATRIDLANGLYSSVTFELNFPFKIKAASSSKRKVYLAALYSCSGVGSASYSSVKKLNTAQVRGKLLTPSRWISKFAKAFS